MSSYFPKTHENVGTIKPHQKVDVIYDYSPDIQIESAIPGCGCSTAIVNHNTHTITVKYTSVDIPQHLKAQGFYISTKNVEVEYIVRESPALTYKIILTFTVKVQEI